jgi:ankyrin repeat protein
MMDGWTPFIYAAVNGYLITVEMLHKEGNCNINDYDKFQRTALHWAARYNNRQMVRKLLDIGVNFKLRDVEK